MPDWSRIVEGFFQMSDPDGEYDHYAPAGASRETIAKVEAAIGAGLPQELRDFYAHHDGLGLISRDEDAIPLFIRSTGELVEYIEQCRSSFRDTHPAEAERYFPFIDLYNGNSSGFLLGSDGQPLDGIFGFSHELYSYAPDQDASEFLQLQADSIASLLSPE